MTKEKMTRLLLNSAQLEVLELMSDSMTIIDADIARLRKIISKLYDELMDLWNKEIKLNDELIWGKWKSED